MRDEKYPFSLLDTSFHINKLDDFEREILNKAHRINKNRAGVKREELYFSYYPEIPSFLHAFQHEQLCAIVDLGFLFVE